MRTIGIIFGLMLLLASDLMAQSYLTPRAVGFSGAMTSVADGYEAGLYNPALLGLNNPTSLTFLGVSAQGGTAPLGIYYFEQFGPRLEDDEKAEILAKIEEYGSLDFQLGVNAHWAGVSSGPIAINIFSEAQLNGNLSPRLAEFALYGNVSPDGIVHDIAIDGTALRGLVTTKAAVSYGTDLGWLPLPGRFLVGATFNLGMINAVAIGRDRGSRIVYDPLSADGAGELILGRKGDIWSVDVGAGWELGSLRLGAMMRNVVQRHRLPAEQIEVYRAVSHVATDTSYSQVDTLSLYQLPESDQKEIEKLIEESISKQNLTVSGALYWGPFVTTAEFRMLSPKFQLEGNVRELALGAAWHPFGWLQFRGGTVLGDDADTISGGATLLLGPLMLDGAASRSISDTEYYRVALQMSFRL